MYTLKVSYDAGNHYLPVMEADDLDTFDEKCAELDKDLLRWVIEDENGEIVPDKICAMHAALFAAIEAMDLEELVK